MTPFDLILHIFVSTHCRTYLPKLKFLASFVPEISGGPKNFKSGSCDPHVTPIDLILHFLCYYSLPSISVRNLKFLASTVPDILGGSKIPKMGYVTPHDPFWLNFEDFGYFPVFYLSVKFMANSFIDDWYTTVWLFYDFADLAAKCLFGPILGSFGGFWPLKLWNCCFDPQRYALPAEMRVR